MAKTNDKQRTAPISRGPEAPKLSSDTNSKNSGKKNKPEKQKWHKRESGNCRSPFKFYKYSIMFLLYNIL